MGGILGVSLTMELVKIETFFDNVYLLKPKVYKDNRGHFFENFNKAVYHQIGLEGPWLQDNVSKTFLYGIRGLHFQYPKPQGKLVSVFYGRIFDVVVDIRRSSTTFGKWIGVELDDKNFNQLWIPKGFAHGFQALSKVAHVNYKCSDNYWSPKDEQTIIFNDNEIGINWPKKPGSISEKDMNGKPLKLLKNLPY